MYVGEYEGVDHITRDLEAAVFGASEASLCYHFAQVMHDKDEHVSAGS